MLAYSFECLEKAGLIVTFLCLRTGRYAILYSNNGRPGQFESDLDNSEIVHKSPCKARFSDRINHSAIWAVGFLYLFFIFLHFFQTLQLLLPICIFLLAFFRLRKNNVASLFYFTAYGKHYFLLVLSSNNNKSNYLLRVKRIKKPLP